jgi:hypothetical protein
MKRGLLFIFLLVPLSCLEAINPKDVILPEYTAKAAIIIKMPLFVTWPEISEIDNKSKPFIIGIFGESELNDSLKEQLFKKKIIGKNVKIIEISDLDDIKNANCHILVIAEATKKELLRIISITRGKPILTVADTKGYAELGIMINVSYREKDNRKLRPLLELNEKALQESSLTLNHAIISSAEKIFSTLPVNK